MCVGGGLGAAMHFWKPICAWHRCSRVLPPTPCTACCQPVCVVLDGWLAAFLTACSYTAPGRKRNSLLLHCSLQRASGRMLVHAVELGSPTNDHVGVLRCAVMCMLRCWTTPPPHEHQHR